MRMLARDAGLAFGGCWKDCFHQKIVRWWRRCRGGVSLRTRRKTSGSGFPCHLLTAISRSTQAMGQEFQQAIVLVENIHAFRSEEHTSELQSLMRISYAVFCLKKKNTK